MSTIVDERLMSTNDLHQELKEAGWIFRQRDTGTHESRHPLRKWVGRSPGQGFEIERWSLQAVLMLCATHEIAQHRATPPVEEAVQ